MDTEAKNAINLSPFCFEYSEKVNRTRTSLKVHCEAESNIRVPYSNTTNLLTDRDFDRIGQDFLIFLDDVEPVNSLVDSIIEVGALLLTKA